MDSYMKSRVRELGLPDVIARNFKRVAVTKEQIDEYNLPLMPLGEDRTGNNKGNSMTKEFKRKYGPKATHLNAFFTRAHFDAFKKIVLDAVDSHWYEEIYDVMKEVYDNIESEDEPESLAEEKLKEERQKMYRKITAAFTPGWYKDMPDAPYYW